MRFMPFEVFKLSKILEFHLTKNVSNVFRNQHKHVVEVLRPFDLTNSPTYLHEFVSKYVM